MWWLTDLCSEFQEASRQGAERGSRDLALCDLLSFQIRHSHHECWVGYSYRMEVVESQVYAFSWIRMLKATGVFCSSSDLSSLKRPNYRLTCEIQPSSYFLYLYTGIPQLMLTVPNLALLGHTWFHLWKTAKTFGASGEQSGVDRKARLWVTNLLPWFQYFPWSYETYWIWV